MWNRLPSVRAGFDLRASHELTGLSGCGGSQVEEEELRTGEPHSSICPDHFNPRPLLPAHAGTPPLTGRAGKAPHCCAPTLTLPSYAILAAPGTVGSAIAQAPRIDRSTAGRPRGAQSWNSRQLNAWSLALLPSLRICGGFSLPQCPYL